jgi:adenylate cyclase
MESCVGSFIMKPTLGQVFALSLLGLAATLGLLFAIVLNESYATIIESSERIRDQASSEISERVTTFLSKAPDTVAAFQRQIKLGLIDPSLTFAFFGHSEDFLSVDPC